MQLGPFNGNNIAYKPSESPYTGGYITNQSESKIIKMLGQCRALSRNQLTEMAEFNVKNALKSLYKKGYLMEYISEQAPPIYTLTSKSYEINRIKNQYIYYRTTDLLRLVAANQLWLKLSKIWTTAIWDLSGDYPIIKKGQGQFIIAAPRLSEGDNVYALRAFNYIDRSDIVKLIIVAASKEQALEIAHNTIPTDFVRYTWDTELKEEVNFYIFKSHNMIPDIAFKNSIAKTS